MGRFFIGKFRRPGLGLGLIEGGGWVGGGNVAEGACWGGHD